METSEDCVLMSDSCSSSLETAPDREAWWGTSVRWRVVLPANPVPFPFFLFNCPAVLFYNSMPFLLQINATGALILDVGTFQGCPSPKPGHQSYLTNSGMREEEEKFAFHLGRHGGQRRLCFQQGFQAQYFGVHLFLLVKLAVLFALFNFFFSPYMKCILQVFVKFSMKYPWCTKSRRLLKLLRLVLFREHLSVPSGLSAPFLALLWGDPWGSQDDWGGKLESWQERKSFRVSPQLPAASEGQVEGRGLGLQKSLFF